MVLLGAALVGIPLAAGTAAWLARRRLVLVTVHGESMAPTYRPGNRVLVLRRRGDLVRRNQVVVVSDPDPELGWLAEAPPVPADATAGPWLIKRATAVAGDPVPASVAAAVDPSVSTVPAGNLVVIGDGMRSGDSRTWGFVPVSQVLGVVVASLGGGNRQ